MSNFPITFFKTESGKIPVMKFIDRLEVRENTKVVNDLRLLSEYGDMLEMPHVRHLSGKLSELRIRGRQEIRLLFVILNHQIIILHGFIKKTNQTPDKEIDTALDRYIQCLQRL